MMTPRDPQKTKKTPKPVKIGFEMIYPMQQEVAADVMEILRRNRDPHTENKRTPIVILQPQCGKTGVMIQLIDSIIKDCKKRKRRFQIVILCGLTHKVLAAQTRARLMTGASQDGRNSSGAGLHAKALNTELVVYPHPYECEGLIISHNSTILSTLDLTTVEVDERYFIEDECHLGNGMDGNIDQLFRRHGIRINEQIHTWDNGKTVNHVIGVSATPFAHLIESEQMQLEGETLFTCVYREPPEEYNSFRGMRASGRLRQAGALFQNDVPTGFLLGVWEEWQQDCKKYGPGYLVMRATGKKHAQLLGYVNRRGAKTECKLFNNEENNLDELNAFLSRKPTEPTVVIIKGSMRAGMTLGAKHYIRGWVETDSEGRDSQAQSGAGRACGYGRKDDVYPIYCNLVALDEVIDGFHQMANNRVKSVPRGIQNHGTGACGLQSQGETFAVRRVRTPEVSRRYIERLKKERGENTKIQTSSTSGTVVHNIADLLLRGKKDSTTCLGYFINGSPSKETIRASLTRKNQVPPSDREVNVIHRNLSNSYRKLIQLHPEYEGMFVEFREHPIAKSDNRSRNDLQKSNSALRSA